MKVGDLVKINDHPHASHYPKGVGVVVDYRDEGLHEMYNTAYVTWPDTGKTLSVRQVLLEVVSETV